MTQTLEKKQLDEFEQLLEESFSKSYTVADIVEGTIIKKDGDGWLVNVRGAKTEAHLPSRETGASDTVEIGDVKEFYVLREENDDENMVLSLKRLSFAQAWAQLSDAKNQGDTILAKVVSIVKGGVLVDVADLKGFIPSSQLRTGTPFDGLIDTKIEVKVIDADPKKNKLILSQRLAVAEQRDQVAEEILSKLEEGMVVKGEIVRIADFGAFVDINGIDGLLPISEISWSRIKHPSDVISLGETIEVKVIRIDTELKRISLSLKRMGEDPWQQIEGQFEEGQVITGTVNKVTGFGA
ncbi:MAG: S1 RNA-binding domain-containing protein, partial [Heliobacteriaceae bacterium]|nr:S1 RNA-binding domain-containing protein [Heliobacteriaceae bacterium]